MDGDLCRLTNFFRGGLRDRERCRRLSRLLDLDLCLCSRRGSLRSPGSRECHSFSSLSFSSATGALGLNEENFGTLKPVGCDIFRLVGVIYTAVIFVGRE